MTEAGDIRTIVSSEGGRRPSADVVYRAWPAENPRAALIIVHGLGGHSERFRECAGLWASRGINCYAPDLPGFGRSAGPKGHVDSFEEMFETLERLVARVMAENSRRPVFLLGESMGAVVAIDWVARRPALLSGLILIAPALQDRLDVPFWRKADGFLNVLLRRRKFYDVPFDPDSFTRDREIIAVLEADPLEVRRVSAQFYFAWLPVTLRAKKEAPLLKLPVLVLLPGEDVMIDSDYTRRWFEDLPEGSKELRDYPGYLHALLIEKNRAPILDDIAGWILRRGGS